MWHQNPNNGIFPSQMPGPSLASQSTCIRNMEDPVSDAADKDFVYDPSRKRKSVAFGHPGNDVSEGRPQSVSENGWPYQPYQQHKVGRFSEINVQGNFPRTFSNQIPLFADSSTMVPQFGRNEIHSMDSFNSTVTERVFPSSADEKLYDLGSRTHPLFYHQERMSTLMNSPAQRISYSDSQFPASRTSSQIDESKCPSHLDPNNERVQSDPSCHGLRDSVNFGGLQYISGGNSSVKSPTKPSGSDESCIPVISGSPFEVNQGGQNVNVAETADISRIRTVSLEHSARTIINETGQSCVASIPPDNGAAVKGKDQNFGDRDIQLIENKQGSNVEDMNHGLGEEVPPINDSRQASCDLNEKSKSQTGKVALITIEKLWDGSIQLNSSTTVSAVAFFKSGEKAPEIDWYDFLEVRGKVRLEAFEKFIQELPRSRSRGLMVTSLCWKIGSSETGLTGMKEVARGYKEGRKVGYAQVSEGIDLYICPRSDTIFTILAKYGYFKGMAAVEDDQDSLIGCVVWRRRQKPPDSILKKEEIKLEHPVNTSNSVIQETAEAKTSSKEPGGSPSSRASEKEFIVPEGAGNKGISDSRNILCSEVQPEAEFIVPEGAGNKGISDSRNILCSEVQPEAGNSLTSISQNQAPSVVKSSPGISMELKPTLFDPISRDNHKKAEVDAPFIAGLNLSKPVSGPELSKAVLPLPLQAINVQNRPAPDDDDLPEFDFSTACGVPQHIVSNPVFSSNNAHALDPGPVDKKLAVEAVMNANGPISSAMPIVHSILTPNQQRLEFPNLPVSSGITSLQDFLENGESPWTQLPFSCAMALAHGSEASNQLGIVKPANSTALGPKSIWDDDDDMPEWCPPDLEHLNQPPPVENVRTNISGTSSQAPNPKSDKLAPGLPPRPSGPPPPRPLGPPPPRPSGPPMMPPGPPPPRPTLPPSMSIYPPLPPGLPPNAYRYQQCPASVSEKPVQARPVGLHTHIGPRPSMGFASESQPMIPQANMFNGRPSSNPSVGHNSDSMHMRPQSNIFTARPPSDPSAGHNPELMPMRPPQSNMFTARPSSKPSFGQNPELMPTRPQSNMFTVRPPSGQQAVWRGWRP